MTKKIIYAISYVCLLVWLTGCSKDKGNYDYQPKNTITIGNVLNGDHNSARIYRFVYGDSINIVPDVKGTVSKNNLSGFSFVWIVDKDTIAKTKDLHITSDRIGFGKKVGNFYITDKELGVFYNYNFTFEITSDAPRGHFVLAEDDQGHSHLYIKTSLRPLAPFKTINKIGEIQLGDNPSGLSLIKNYGSSSTNYTYSLITATKQGAPYHIIQFLLGDMLPSILYNNNSTADAKVTLEPTFIDRNRSSGRVGYILNKGKAYTLSLGTVSPVLYSQDPLNYDFGEKGLIINTSLYGYYIAGFDQRNSRFRVFSNNWATQNLFVKNYDNIIDPSLTAGHTFVGGAEGYDGSAFFYTLLTKKGNTLYLFKLTFDATYTPKEFTLVATKEISNIDKLSSVFFNAGNKFWYLSIGREIYSTSILGLDLQLSYALPNDGSGDIVAFNFNYNEAAAYTLLGVATYNPASSLPHKGSYYLFNYGDRQVQETSLNTIDKAKAIQIGL
ncbi:MAG: hypothetical protein J7577_18360 [Sphingobacteriaceae bacterium]|nr:hypothetical protein [Sphingobacteriaceae bacterium]